jgi:hypothetical protein
MGPPRVTDADRAHFRAIAAASRPLPEDAPPRSLTEMFERLDAIRKTLGPAAQPGLTGEDESELESHLRMLRRAREIGLRGTKRA